MALNISYVNNKEYAPEMDVNLNKTIMGEKTIIGTNSLNVSANTTANMGVKVAIGSCWINGYFINNTASYSLTITGNTSGYSRIDAIVIEGSATGAFIKVVQGTASNTPTCPSIANNQIKLAEVTVINNATAIQTSNIKDTRSNIMTSLDAAIHALENKVSNLEEKQSTRREYTGSGVVKSIIIETNKEAKIKRQYLKCSLTAEEWKGAWQNINAGTNNYNGGIWIPFYDAVNTSNVIDASINITGLNKWVWISPGACKFGFVGIGGIGSGGCYAFIENKYPSENTIGIEFTVCIVEKY